MSRSCQKVLRSVLKLSEPGVKTKNEWGLGVIVDWVVRDGLSEMTFELSPEEKKELALERAWGQLNKCKSPEVEMGLMR